MSPTGRGGKGREGGRSGVPREPRGGLIGGELRVWEEKAEAGPGGGEDKRGREGAARRGRPAPGSAAAALPSRGPPPAADSGGVGWEGPPFPSLPGFSSLFPRRGGEKGLERKGGDPRG